MAAKSKWDLLDDEIDAGLKQVKSEMDESEGRGFRKGMLWAIQAVLYSIIALIVIVQAVALLLEGGK